MNKRRVNLWWSYNWCIKATTGVVKVLSASSDQLTYSPVLQLCINLFVPDPYTTSSPICILSLSQEKIRKLCFLSCLHHQHFHTYYFQVLSFCSYWNFLTLQDLSQSHRYLKFTSYRLAWKTLLAAHPCVYSSSLNFDSLGGWWEWAPWVALKPLLLHSLTFNFTCLAYK